MAFSKSLIDANSYFSTYKSDLERPRSRFDRSSSVKTSFNVAAQNGVDFSIYDTDNNGYVDNVFVYYAGYNEAEHGPDNTVWSHRWANLS